MNKKDIDTLKTQALKYHAAFPVGKIATALTKSCDQESLKLAYSPGVAEPCLEIEKNPQTALEYTAKGNNVMVVTNGTAVLGLGDIGALAAKPVMEGKAFLMKALAGVDACDLSIEEKDPKKLFEIIKGCANSWGAINLEDIKAPECFELLKLCQDNLEVPVFHDDQDGTAVIATAALLNALKLIGKDLSQVKIICSGAGAAMIATLRLLREFGLQVKNVWLFDSKGLIYDTRENTTGEKLLYAKKEKCCSSIAQAMQDADVFIGLSQGGVLKAEDLKVMKEKPILLAMANPIPEIMPDVAKEVRPDCIVGTGRSDYPNQVNNSTCFPYLFRAVLDSRTSKITLSMLKAVVEGIMNLAQSDKDFGPEKIVPSTLDQRLPYVIVNKVIDVVEKENLNITPVKRMYTHAYLYPVKIWEGIFEKEAKKSVQITGLDSQCLLDYISDFASYGDDFEVEIVREIGEVQCSLFKQGDEVFIVGSQGKELENEFGMKRYEVDVCTAGKFADLICSIDFDKKKIYVDHSREHFLRKAIFAAALMSRVG